MNNRNLELSLASMRISLGGFLLLWAFMKVLVPENSVNILAGFYGMETGEMAVVLVGFIQITFVLAFVLGVFKTVTYGGVLIFHTVSVLSTVPRLIDPYTSPNGLFWAGVPLIVMFAVLFAFRKEDTFLSFNYPRTA